MGREKEINNQSQEEKQKIGDILASIRGMIENPNLDNNSKDIVDEKEFENYEDPILELTKVADQKFKPIQGTSYSEESIINNLMRPLLKEWLDNNLPRLVEKIIAEEIRRLVQEK